MNENTQDTQVTEEIFPENREPKKTSKKWIVLAILAGLVVLGCYTKKTETETKETYEECSICGADEDDCKYFVTMTGKNGKKVTFCDECAKTYKNISQADTTTKKSKKKK